ncbi:MAG: class II SORL domain-containing protein [Candidatus Omnitrophica bacterium]|nr:class II SORL domain-containing protein [Candidatus Omnitrophota bacterium]
MAEKTIKDLFQSADYKTEKHIPVIEGPEVIRKGEVVSITVSVGKQIPHPNTTEHHIRWIEIYFHPQTEKFPYQIARFELAAHGESVQGPNASTVYTQPMVLCSFKTEKSGTLIASSYCNIHGLWESSKELRVE